MRERRRRKLAERKSLIGSGDRSDRIRTYNFPQGRVTDHRINLTLHKIESIMDGDLAELTGALAAEHQAELLAGLAQSALKRRCTARCRPRWKRPWPPSTASTRTCSWRTCSA